MSEQVLFHVGRVERNFVVNRPHGIDDQMLVSRLVETPLADDEGKRMQLAVAVEFLDQGQDRAGVEPAGERQAQRRIRNQIAAHRIEHGVVQRPDDLGLGDGGVGIVAQLVVLPLGCAAPQLDLDQLAALQLFEILKRRQPPGNVGQRKEVVQRFRVDPRFKVGNREQRLELRSEVEPIAAAQKEERSNAVEIAHHISAAAFLVDQTKREHAGQFA